MGVSSAAEGKCYSHVHTGCKAMLPETRDAI